MKIPNVWLVTEMESDKFLGLFENWDDALSSIRYSFHNVEGSRVIELSDDRNTFHNCTFRETVTGQQFRIREVPVYDRCAIHQVGREGIPHV